VAIIEGAGSGHLSAAQQTRVPGEQSCAGGHSESVAHGVGLPQKPSGRHTDGNEHRLSSVHATFEQLPAATSQRSPNGHIESPVHCTHWPELQTLRSAGHFWQLVPQ
jgi:hypothetical protein